MQGGVKASLACAPGVPTVVGMGELWEIELYATVDGACPFEAWHRKLPAGKQVVIKESMQAQLVRRGTGVCSDDWGRALGGGLYELRMRQRGVLLRVFFAPITERRLLVLGGLDKGRHAKRQTAAIQACRDRLAEWHRRNMRFTA
jgi:putative component of toxin-antitoxin plasmid stabilization module